MPRAQKASNATQESAKKAASGNDAAAEAQEERLHIQAELQAARVVTDDGILLALRGPNAAVGCPEMPEEHRNRLRRLREYGFGHTLLGGPKPEDAEFVQPRGDRIPDTMGQSSGSR